MIPKNTHNTIPLHRSKDQWYKNYPTYKGACNQVVAPNGYLPLMQLTCGSADVPQLSLPWTLDGTIMSMMPMEGSMIPVGQSYALSATDTSVTPNVTYQLEYDYRNGYFEVRFENANCSKVDSSPTADDYKFTAEELSATGTHKFYTFNGGVVLHEIVITGSMLAASSIINITLVSCEDGMEIAIPTSVFFEIVPDNYRTTTRCASFILGGSTIYGGADDGLYYLKMVVGGETYYTEPFLWLSDLTNFVHITYRRSLPILTAKNYIPFTRMGVEKYMEMWVKSLIAKPPFHYEEDIEDMDGRKFVEKQVSYRDDQFNFLCSAYFADAVRLLWHCDQRQYDQFNDIRDVDYMEPPEPNWDLDTHLCEITIEFQSDTIVQTNGEISVSADGSIGSFNQDYNNDYQEN